MAAVAAFIGGLALRWVMPKTLEIVCADQDCELDMAELHYTYDMPEGTGPEDFECPYCGGPVEALSP